MAKDNSSTVVGAENVIVVGGAPAKVAVPVGAATPPDQLVPVFQSSLVVPVHVWIVWA